MGENEGKIANPAGILPSAPEGAVWFLVSKPVTNIKKHTIPIMIWQSD